MSAAGAPTELRLAPESIEALAVRLAELIKDGHLLDEPEIIPAAEVSRRWGVQRRWVYEHADELGAIPLGDGPRPRLRFDVKVLIRRLGPPDCERRARTDLPRSRWINASRNSDSLSSRTRANVNAPRESVSGAAR
ncbi:MAG: hypothetical protein JSU06_02335 [Actinobacteria bacterium]|nr:hypothetical protein [Actinomycetota bacterium]